MTTAPLSLPQRPWLRGKNLVFGFIGLMLAYVLYHDEIFLINPHDPKWLHIHPFRWYLLFHGVAGTCALLLAPMQFSDRLRRKYIQLHRTVGYIYVVGALVAAPMGAYIQFFEERMGASRSFSFAALSQATTWMVTTLIALLLILQGKVDTELRRRAGIFGGTRGRRRYGLGKPGPACDRNHRVGLQHLFSSCR